MRNITATGNLYGETVTIKQISKAKALKLFAAGETIYLQSSNMSPFNMWQSVHGIDLDQEQLNRDIKNNNFCIRLYSEQVDECNNSGEQWRKNLLPEYEEKLKSHMCKVIDARTQFNQIVNEYSFYHCDSERGKYVTFYSKQ